MQRKSKFEKDFLKVGEFFPKLSYFWNSKSRLWIIKGDIDICDTEGEYWETYNIIIGIPENYPHCVPIVLEKSDLIPRNIDWHISKEGVCCIDIGHNLIAMSKRGINIFSFIREKIYPYLANQVYKIERKVYAGKEYLHHFDGVIQYYMEEHNLSTIDSIISILDRIVLNNKIGRNENCPCGSGEKTKDCHLESIYELKSIGKEKLKEDLKLLKEKLNG